MKTPIATHEQRHLAAQREPSVTDLERLAKCGFSASESAALLWLRHWDHMGGSDRVELVRHWEFLKWLVVSGRLDV